LKAFTGFPVLFLFAKNQLISSTFLGCFRNLGGRGFRINESTIAVSIMAWLRLTPEFSLIRRAIDLWPYLFIVISVTGLACITLAGSH